MIITFGLLALFFAGVIVVLQRSQVRILESEPDRPDRSSDRGR